MARWEPNSRGRLADAAFALFRERGFDNTTVAEIAGRAGLTERTFFRHFADKREVLFAGSHELADQMVQAVREAPESLAPIDVVGAALEAAAAFLPERERARQRQVIITAHPDLQERELIKFASLSAALAETLRARGLKEPAASLMAELAMSIFRVAFERWVADDNDRDLLELMREALDELKAVTAAA